MKKIFGLLIVRNEDDIIESYLRYNLTYLNGIFVYENNRSYDNTRIIIQNLIDEGLPINFVDDLAEPGLLNSFNVQNMAAQRAVDEYGADLVICLDSDEFLYHTDGINPREALEAMREDIEYQCLWRTYVYEKEPDVELGFMPNNFTHYRSPEMESPERYEMHKKVITSKYLIKNKQAFFGSPHFLSYPDENKNTVNIEIHDKLVFAHFPIRSRVQVMKKAIPNWIQKMRDHVLSRHRDRFIYDAFQLGVLFNELRDFGEITTDSMKQHSLEYAMLLDFTTSHKSILINREELDRFKNDLGDNLQIPGSMNTDFCADRLSLLYTDYSENYKNFIRATLNEIDVMFTHLHSEYDEQVFKINELYSTINELHSTINELHSTFEQQIACIYNSNTWKAGEKLQRIYRFIIPKRKQQDS